MNDEEALRRIAEIECELTKFSQDYNFRYDFTTSLIGSIPTGGYEQINIKVYKELN